MRCCLVPTFEFSLAVVSRCGSSGCQPFLSCVLSSGEIDGTGLLTQLACSSALRLPTIFLVVLKSHAKLLKGFLNSSGGFCSVLVLVNHKFRLPYVTNTKYRLCYFGLASNSSF
jgi:hypothetical protein